MASVGQGGVGFECRAPIGWRARLAGAGTEDLGSHWSGCPGGVGRRVLIGGRDANAVPIGGCRPSRDVFVEDFFFLFF